MRFVRLAPLATVVLVFLAAPLAAGAQMVKAPRVGLQGLGPPNARRFSRI